jgi:hypothetical protein
LSARWPHERGVLSLSGVSLGVKKLLFGLAVTVLVAELAIAFSGCGQSDSSTDDGPACEPACVDALFENLGDLQFATESGSDGGATCEAACAKLTDFHGCPYPGCAAECERGLPCPQASGDYVELLTCEISATYTCESTDLGLLPVTKDCADAEARILKSCGSEDAGGDVSPDAGCSAVPSECAQCCATMHSEGFDSYNLALTACACGSPGVCATPCSSETCEDMAPTAGDSCSMCLATATGPDGGCTMTVAQQCGLDPDCMAYEACLTTNHCPGP